MSTSGDDRVLDLSCENSLAPLREIELGEDYSQAASKGAAAGDVSPTGATAEVAWSAGATGGNAPPFDATGANTPIKVLDKSSETASTNDEPEISYQNYDSRPAEDEARKIIAFSLIGILFFIVYWAMLSISFGTLKITELKELAALLSPIVALVGSATGFYYGTKSK